MCFRHSGVGSVFLVTLSEFHLVSAPSISTSGSVIFSTPPVVSAVVLLRCCESFLASSSTITSGLSLASLFGFRLPRSSPPSRCYSSVLFSLFSSLTRFSSTSPLFYSALLYTVHDFYVGFVHSKVTSMKGFYTLISVLIAVPLALILSPRTTHHFSLSSGLLFVIFLPSADLPFHFEDFSTIFEEP